MKTLTQAQATAQGFEPFTQRIEPNERWMLDGFIADMVAVGRPYCVVDLSRHRVAVWAKPIPTHKVCARCKVSKPLDDYTSGKCQGDVDSTCKPCRRVINKEYRARKKEKAA